MTTSVATSRPARNEIDVRCSAALPRPDASEGRCQLFAGHDSPHAIMFGRRGTRTVRTWHTKNPGAAIDECPGGMQRLPWMFGFPAPAWFESGPARQSPD